jgi:hypothetical protein
MEAAENDGEPGAAATTFEAGSAYTGAERRGDATGSGGARSAGEESGGGWRRGVRQRGGREGPRSKREPETGNLPAMKENGRVGFGLNFTGYYCNFTSVLVFAPSPRITFFTGRRE